MMVVCVYSVGSDPQVDTPSGAESSSASPGVTWVSGPPLVSSLISAVLVSGSKVKWLALGARVRYRIILLSWFPVQRSRGQR